MVSESPLAWSNGALEYAAAWFLLADHLRDAAQVCINQVGDLQLAIAITRAYEGDDGPVLKEILEERVLPEAASDGNRWMASWAFWMLGRRDMAVRSLIVSLQVPCTVRSTTDKNQLVARRGPSPSNTRLSRQSRNDTLAGEIVPF